MFAVACPTLLPHAVYMIIPFLQLMHPLMLCTQAPGFDYDPTFEDHEMLDEMLSPDEHSILNYVSGNSQGLVSLTLPCTLTSFSLVMLGKRCPQLKGQLLVS